MHPDQREKKDMVDRWLAKRSVRQQVAIFIGTVLLFVVTLGFMIWLLVRLFV